MQYDENGNRIYGEFTDMFGNEVAIKRASMRHPMVTDCAQIRVAFTNGTALYAYPSRRDAAVMIDALAAFLGDTDGIPDLSEPDAEG